MQTTYTVVNLPAHSTCAVHPNIGVARAAEAPVFAVGVSPKIGQFTMIGLRRV
jgi:hypothetical protein